MCLTCCDCGKTFSRPGRRGRLPNRCNECSRLHEKTRNTKKRQRYAHVCRVCGIEFENGRKKQEACSPPCRKQWAKTQAFKRYHAKCSEPCGNPVCPRTRKKGTKFCCPACRHAVQYPPMLVCQNPACGREFRMKHRTKDAWKNKGKYCTPECFQDHRWGQDRPRKQRSLSARRSASQAALAKSLRKKCKVLQVTFDPACTRQAVLERDNWVCQKCRLNCNKEYKFIPGTRTPDPRNAEHDHIIPLSVPGSPGNVFENSQCLCRECNSKKRDKPQGQLRLPIEEEAWGKGVRVRRQPSSRFSGATLAAVP